MNRPATMPNFAKPSNIRLNARPAGPSIASARSAQPLSISGELFLLRARHERGNWTHQIAPDSPLPQQSSRQTPPSMFTRLPRARTRF